MIHTNSYAARSASSPLAPFSFDRRDVSENDVEIEILYCGVCHSDIHQVRSEWGEAIYPIVPGHEIVGRIKSVGSQVTKFKVGDLAGIGCFVDSCRTCENCQSGEEQFCDEGMVGTYNSYEKDGKTPTYGGYSSCIVVDEKYTLKVPSNLPLPGVAPLLCAGITTYSPLRHVGVKPGDKVAVLGLGGLGHMAVKFAAAFGAEVTMISTSPSKQADAEKLGAKNFILSTDKEAMKKASKSFNVILNTVSADHNYNDYLSLLKTNGTMIIVGIPETPSTLPAISLIGQRRSIMGSLIGGIAETQEMLDFCAEHHIVSEVEVIPMDYINQAYERMIKNDVKYRFVIDTSTLNQQ